MEAFDSIVFTRTQFLCTFSAFRRSPALSNGFTKSPSWIERNRSHSFPRNPFACSSSTACRYPRIWAWLGRASKRRNSLRKKLLDEGKVRNSPDFFNPFRNLNNSNGFSEQNEKSQIDSNLDNSEGSDFSRISGSGVGNSTIEQLNVLDNSVLRSELESWADQYKKDTEYWGVGSGPIFTIYQDLHGNVLRVLINTDEILRRSGFEPRSFKSNDVGEDAKNLKSKISFANTIAREIESGEYKLVKNSSIATVVVQDKKTSFLEGLHSASLQSNSPWKLSQIAFVMFCGCFILWAAKNIFVGGNNEVKLTREEEEMLRRKIRSRMEKVKAESGNAEVVGNDLSLESLGRTIERPQVDKDELMKTISKAKAANSNSSMLDYSDKFSTSEGELNPKILEIQEMARQARELERQSLSELDKDGYENDVPIISQAFKEETSTHESNSDKNTDSVPKALEANSENETKSLSSVASGKVLHNNDPIEARSLENSSKEDTQCFSELSASSDNENRISRTSKMEALKNDLNVVQDPSRKELVRVLVSHATEEKQSDDQPNNKSATTSKSSIKLKPRIISSVEEAQDYLSRKCGKLDVPPEQTLVNGEGANGNEDVALNEKIKFFKPSKIDKASDPNVVFSASVDTAPVEDISDDIGLQLEPSVAESSDSLKTGGVDKKLANANESWIEENFHKFDPIIKKIGVGFQENYKTAKIKTQEQSSLSLESLDTSQLGFKEDNGELDWMRDDNLREIVFQVRENELAGRDPFHLIDVEDQNAFFKGLERKVEKVNEEVLGLHEWIHSRIENLDYGSDGISIYDPPEKIIPRWKGPTLEKDPEFLKNFVEHRNKFFKEKLGTLKSTNQQQHDDIQKLEEPSSSPISPSYGIHNLSKKQKDEASREPKTVIECSDGSIRAGKKSGKEHWQHTKKWTQEFLEVYNAETDPEVKSIMKDMGKDLDRWITEKEIQEAADLMTRIPKRKRRYIEKKMEKLKREIEMFGQHAVVSKYQEYSEEKEEDYLWWLDLSHVLCIEMYINEDGNQRVGFYSLEMAADLELNPKQYHVVAFEDPGDCKNFCYIIQAHMEMLGNGCAFVVARPPKVAFREAKANGFSVTVIRKGQLRLNVDQELEEVENEITEIGSRMYHDKIMREHSVDMSGLIKGIFGAGKTTKRRSKRMLTMPTEH